MTEREPGFYWVKWGGEWEIAQWWNTEHGWFWRSLGEENPFIGDKHLEAIGPRIEKPEELT